MSAPSPSSRSKSASEKKAAASVSVKATADRSAKPKRHDFRAKDEDELPPPESHPVYFRARGMHDVLPDEQSYWEIITETVRTLATSFNFQRIETPVVEVPEIFERSLGTTSDVVEKELFFVRDRTGKEKLVLRPEMTAGVVRAYLEHGMQVLPRPVRLWYQGPMFRHDRPQAGRYRQFTQFGFEVIGEGSALIDAQMIHLAYEIYRGLQLEAFRIDVNSMGHMGADCRQRYLELLKEHAVSALPKLCADCKRRARKNPLRILDCKEEKCQMVANTAPKLTEHLCGACAAHYKELKSHLTDLGIPVKENPRLVRGFDYYTKTVFEVLPTSVGKGLQGAVEGFTGGTGAAAGASAGVPPALALGGGGRYDGLVELFGGPPTPAVGFSGGVERIILAMRSEGIQATRTGQPEIFLVYLGDLGRKRALKLFDELRRAGFHVAEAFHKPGIKAQLRAADRARIPWALILGQKEALDNTVIIRNMESGTQETIDVNLDVLVPALKKRLRVEGEV